MPSQRQGHQQHGRRSSEVHEAQAPAPEQKILVPGDGIVGVNVSSSCTNFPLKNGQHHTTRRPSGGPPAVSGAGISVPLRDLANPSFEFDISGKGPHFVTLEFADSYFLSRAEVRVCP
jgi:hypothetical protein